MEGREWHSPTLTELDEISQEIASFLASEHGFSDDDLQRALDPRSNVALRATRVGQRLRRRGG